MYSLTQGSTYTHTKLCSHKPTPAEVCLRANLTWFKSFYIPSLGCLGLQAQNLNILDQSLRWHFQPRSKDGFCSPETPTADNNFGLGAGDNCHRSWAMFKLLVPGTTQRLLTPESGTRTPRIRSILTTQYSIPQICTGKEISYCNCIYRFKQHCSCMHALHCLHEFFNKVMLTESS